MNNFYFILSFSRSGSTLLAKLLNNNKDLKVLNETWIFPTLSILKWERLNYNKQRYVLHIYNQSLKIYKNCKPVSHKICEKRSISFVYFYKKILKHNISIALEKNPVNTLHFAYLNKNIKNSKFIFLTRNPIAIANSYRNRWLKNEDYNYFLFRVTTVIKTYFLSYQKYYNDPELITIRYEDLVKDPVDSLNRLCNHLGVNYDKKMLDNIDAFLFKSSSLKSHKDLSKEIHVKNINKYRSQLSKEQIQDLSYLLRDVFNFFNYPVSLTNPSQSLLKIERKVNNRLRYNKSFVKRYVRRAKYYLLYLKYTIIR